MGIMENEMEPIGIGPPPPVIVTIMHSKHYIRVLFYSYYTTFSGGGPPYGDQFVKSKEKCLSGTCRPGILIWHCLIANP